MASLVGTLLAMSDGIPPYTIRTLAWQDEELGTIPFPSGVMTIRSSFGSGLARRASDQAGIVWAVGDRGPIVKPKTLVERYGVADMKRLAKTSGAKIMPRLDLGPSVAKLQVHSDRVELLEVIRIRAPCDGPISGLPPPSSEHALSEPVFDLEGNPLDGDPSGLDTEGIAAASSGGFWIGDEFGPSLVQLDPVGRVTVRYVPEGTPIGGAEYPVHACLPRIAGKRQLNRGFEAIALSPDERSLFIAFQSPLAHPDEDAHRQARHVRIWRLDTANLEVTDQYLYPLDDPATFLRDEEAGKLDRSDLKISELVALSDDALLVLERGSQTTKLYRVRLSSQGAGDLAWLDTATRPTLEELSGAGEPLPELAKELVLSSDDARELVADFEGMALLSPSELLLINDNDFGIEGVHTTFALVTFASPLIE